MKKKTNRIENLKEVEESLKREFKFNTPNIITIIRLILTFLIVYMIFSDYSRITIAIVFAIAALSDSLDGFVARKFNKKTRIGGRLDQVVDRIFTVTIIIAFIFYFLIGDFIDKNFMLMLFLVSSREIIGLPAVLIRIIMDKDVYEVRYIGKITCWFQGVALTLIIAGFNFAIYFAILACIAGIFSGFDYLKLSFYK